MARKTAFCDRLNEYLNEYSKILIVDADNVRSSQLQSVRKSLRGRAVLLMGKNTMVRRVLRERAAEDAKFGAILDHVAGNVGFVFTNGDLIEIRDQINQFKIGAPAKAGVIAPISVTVPAGLTGLDPSQTNFFQSCAIPTKIQKGQIEILNDVPLIVQGERVGASQAALLVKLKIEPFEYGLDLVQVYDDGAIFAPAVLDLTDDDIVNKFKTGVLNIAALSLAIGYPTLASVPHSLANGYKNVLAIALATDYTFKQCEELKALLNDPEALAEIGRAHV